MYKYKILIAYDGTSYGGWQNQPNTVSIQSLLEEALSTVLRKPTSLIGSGRTDAGVHAEGQVAHFSHDTLLPFDKVRYSLNGLLPPDIRILQMEAVDDTFHAQYSVSSKIYTYHLHLSKTIPPFFRLYRWHISYPLDKEAMKKAASFLIGTHDFSAFSNKALEGSCAKDPIRTLKRIDFIEEGELLKIELEGDGFLYKMVRNIIGTLVEIGSGKLPIEAIQTILLSKDRKLAGQTAPAQGLFLTKVYYLERLEMSHTL